MTITDLFNSILAVAKVAIPLVAGSEAGKYVATAEAILKTIDAVRPLVDAAKGEQLDVTRAELDATIARVNAHADQTIDKLG